ncbi:MAG: peptide chain release factor N(5)-glutamine methyltransferase, partial [Planctomycetota bacterium]|nr:peptide chain release factor N(5)-glutamine methyltransferase [Planctomycetota bacterium]
PPYLAEAEAAELALELAHEPKEALFAGPLGTEVLARIVEAAPEQLRPGGWLALELAPAQAETVTDWLDQAGFESIETHRDLGNRARVVSGRKPRGED